MGVGDGLTVALGEIDGDALTVGRGVAVDVGDGLAVAVGVGDGLTVAVGVGDGAALFSHAVRSAVAIRTADKTAHIRFI